MAQVTLEDLTRTYDGYNVVDNVSLEIKNGEFFVFVGPSGSGKSTILRLIAGLVEPTSGRIKFDERDVTALEARQRNVAMVFQNYALYPHKNVYDNIAFGLRARKVAEDTVGHRVEEAASMLGVARYLKRSPRELSGGERQRVAIGRAIVREPAVFLLDEPLSNLDARLRLEMRHEIAKIHERVKNTFIYVTHDQVEAMTLGGRIAVINHGRLEQVDGAANLYELPANRFVAGFIGSPPMNFMEGVLRYRGEDRGAELKTPNGSLKLEGNLDRVLCHYKDRELAMGIRPESLRLEAQGKLLNAGRINRVEPIGHEGFIYLSVLGRDLIARVQNWKDYSELDAVSVGFHADDIYLFLSEDGGCIWSKGEIRKLEGARTQPL